MCNFGWKGCGAFRFVQKPTSTGDQRDDGAGKQTRRTSFFMAAQNSRLVSSPEPLLSGTCRLNQLGVSTSLQHRPPVQHNRFQQY